MCPWAAIVSDACFQYLELIRHWIGKCENNIVMSH